MPFDQHKNLAISRVIAPPSPATLGTAVDIVPGHEVRFPAPPFNVTIWPPSAIPDPANAEVARVTLIQANRFFIERTQEGTTARAIQIGDFIAETITAKAFFDIESGTNFPLITTPGPITSGDSVTAPVGNFGTLNALHAPTHAAGGTDPVTLTQGQVTGLPEALASIEGDVNTLQTDVNAIEADVDTLQNTVANGPVALHAPAHAQGGTDPVDVKVLTGYPGGTTSFLRADKTFATPTGIVPSAHAATHKAGGSDLLQVTTLPGYPGGTGTFLRADATFAALPVGQQPGLHAPTHAIGGSDPVVKVWREGRTWALVGDISSLTMLPGSRVPMVAAQTVKLVSIFASVLTGSVGVQVQRNGVNVGGVVSVTTSGAETTLGNLALANNDELKLVLSAPASAPTNLSATLTLEHTV